jgi:hypothetical protein
MIELNLRHSHRAPVHSRTVSGLELLRTYASSLADQIISRKAYSILQRTAQVLARYQSISRSADQIQISTCILCKKLLFNQLLLTFSLRTSEVSEDLIEAALLKQDRRRSSGRHKPQQIFESSEVIEQQN